MRALIQRVTAASVTVENSLISSIDRGLLVLVGITAIDTAEDIDWLCGKISRLRIFDDEKGIMNYSVADIGGEILVVSQFTLYASTRKGNRPGYTRAAPPAVSVPLYEQFVKSMKATSGLNVKTGEFGANMKIQLLNDGPVTIWMDSQQRE